MILRKQDLLIFNVFWSVYSLPFGKLKFLFKQKIFFS